MSWRRLYVQVAAVTAALLLSVPGAIALHYYGYAGTTVYGYNTGAEPAENHADTYVPVRFRVNQDTGAGTFGIVANSRLYKDVTGDADVNGRVYYGYMQYKSPGNWLEVDVGRQYIAAGATAATLDGARAIIKGGNKWRADLYGGSTVTPDFGPMRRFSEMELKDKANAPYDRGYWLDDYTYGVHGGTNVKELWSGMLFPMWLGVSGSLSKRNGHISDTTVGLDSTQDFPASLKASEEVAFDWIGGHVNYQYYSLRHRHKSIPLKTYIDYRWQEPRVDYASIFSVFDQEGRHRARVGGQYKVSEIIQPFADYSASIRGEKINHRVKAGLDQNFGFTYLRYGGLYGVSNRSIAGGDECGAFASAEFPKPIPSFERLSVGTSVDYLRYKGYETPAPGWEDTLLYDLHGRLNVWRTFETTLGAEALKNPDRKYEVRAYLQASASISG